MTYQKPRCFGKADRFEVQNPQATLSLHRTHELLDRTRELNVDRTRELICELNLDRTRKLSRELNVDRTHELSRELNVDRTRGLSRELSLDRTHEINLDRTREYNPDRPRGLKQYEVVRTKVGDVVLFLF